jgi:hypothetical protein
VDPSFPFPAHTQLFLETPAPSVQLSCCTTSVAFAPAGGAETRTASSGDEGINGTVPFGILCVMEGGGRGSGEFRWKRRINHSPVMKLEYLHRPAISKLGLFVHRLPMYLGATAGLFGVLVFRDGARSHHDLHRYSWALGCWSRPHHPKPQLPRCTMVRQAR